LAFDLAGLGVLFSGTDSQAKRLAEKGGRPFARKTRSPRMPAQILVVDDAIQVRSIIGTTLERQGYRVLQAASGREAVDLLEENAIDLVLTEVVIPDWNGIALMEQIRSQHPQLPVVMVTTVREITVAIDSMHRGAYDYLLKPFEREHLLATVERALEHRVTLQESHRYQQDLERAVHARTDMLRQAMDELEHSYDVTLEALGDALDLRDSETEGHSKRVTAYTIMLARAMGVDAAMLKTIARGAFLHDIGKMAIPDEILRKPRSLSPKELTVMRDHCTRGYQMLRKIPFLSEAAEIVFTHHEHHDGTGYPAGLSGSQIPIGSSIFAVADAVDAITSDRPYRKARNFEAARKEIVRCAGTQFNPNVVEVFLKFPNELWLDLRKEITGQEKLLSTLDIASSPTQPKI